MSLRIQVVTLVIRLRHRIAEPRGAKGGASQIKNVVT